MLALIMEGERRHHRDPTVNAPPWSSLFDDPKTEVGYRHSTAAIDEGGGELRIGESSALQILHRELPCSDFMTAEEEDTDEPDFAVDVYSSDEFRMYEFKVRQCVRGRPHDWTECPFAHPGEKARRRDPRKYHYSGTACQDFRKGGCSRGEVCEFAHGVFECWLHPARYRTQPCKDGTACRRPVCFFAHTPDQLRILSSQHQAPAKTPAAIESYDGSPLRQLALESYISKHLMSPPISPPSGSPPTSPSSAALHRASWSAGTPTSEIMASLRQLHLSKTKSLPSSWVMQLGNGLLASPRDSRSGSRAGFCSLPATPTTASMGGRGGMGWLDGVDGGIAEEEPEERLESGRALRAKMFEKLRKECVMDKGVAASSVPAPDVGCVSELVK